MNEQVVGIDVAKATFDLATQKADGKRKDLGKVPNTQAGITRARRWIAEHAPGAAICMEATGTYHEALAEALVADGYTVYVVNPAQISAFGKSELSRTKTDRTDAQLIMRFLLAQRAANKPPVPWKPLPASQKRLRDMVRRLDDLKEMRQMEANRLEVSSASVHPSIHQVLATLDAQIEGLERMIRDHIDSDPDLRGRRDLLTSIPGIAETTSAWLLASVGDLSQFSDVRQLVAHAGLNPALRESGKFKGHTRISRVGDAALRAKLYMPAVCAKRHNPILGAFAQRLAERGKPGKVIICAVMRKLLHLAWGVLRSGQPFNPKFGLAPT
jgi:transposase